MILLSILAYKLGVAVCIIPNSIFPQFIFFKGTFKKQRNYALLAAVYTANILQWRLRILYSEDAISVLRPISNSSIAWPSDTGAMIYSQIPPVTY